MDDESDKKTNEPKREVAFSRKSPNVSQSNFSPEGMNISTNKEFMEKMENTQHIATDLLSPNIMDMKTIKLIAP